MAKLQDLNDINTIIEKAKVFLKKTGLSQWQSGKPNQETLKLSILEKTCFVLEVDGLIVGTINLSTHDPVYDEIDGQWQQPNMPYVVIHTLAVHNHYRGESLGQKLLDSAMTWAQSQGIHQLRVDTHQDNVRMLSLLQKNGFEFAGVVRVDDPIDPKRNAYQYFL